MKLEIDKLPELPFKKGNNSSQPKTGLESSYMLTSNQLGNMRKALIHFSLSESSLMLALHLLILKKWSNNKEFEFPVLINKKLIFVFNSADDEFLVDTAKRIESELIGNVNVVCASILIPTDKEGNCFLSEAEFSTKENGLLIEISLLDNDIAICWTMNDDYLMPDVFSSMFQALGNTISQIIDKDVGLSGNIPIFIEDSHFQHRTEKNSSLTNVSHETLHSLFLLSVGQYGDNLAIIHGGRSITYSDCFQLSMAMAELLRSQGIKQGDVVAIGMDKSANQLIAALAILYVGAVYVPIDISWPDERVASIIQVSSACCMVVNEDCSRFESFNLIKKICCIKSVSKKFQPGEVDVVNNASLTAYIIFTSGSTGKPKGVVINHIGAVNTILDINNRFAVTSNDRIYALSSLGFDLSVYDIFGILAVGGCVVIPTSYRDRSVALWAREAITNGVNCWNSVPALAELFASHAEDGGVNVFESMRLCMMSGDWIPVRLPDRIKTLSNKLCRVISLGGATEASIWSVYYEIDKSYQDEVSIPYGAPLRNQSCYVLDSGLNESPNWVSGDLYIGGVGLAIEYMGDEEKTRNSFITHNGMRLYRTGDKARYNNVGILEFLGREDNQVKVNGYRIELGEIEGAINSHPGVNRSIVKLINNNNSKNLAAFIEPVASGSEGLNIVNHFSSDNILLDHDERLKVIHSMQQSNSEKKGKEICIAEYIGQSPIFNFLNSIAATTTPDCFFQKRMYPSASSLYPVRMSISLAEDVCDVPKGVYDYDPISNSLIRKQDENKTLGKYTVAELTFWFELTEIYKLYPAQLANRLCLLELGYLFEHLNSTATVYGIGFQYLLEAIDSFNVDTDYCGRHPNDIAKIAMSLNGSTIFNSTGNDYYARQSFRHFLFEIPSIDKVHSLVNDCMVNEGPLIVIALRQSFGKSPVHCLLINTSRNVHWEMSFASYINLFEKSAVGIAKGASFSIFTVARKIDLHVQHNKLLIESGRFGQRLMLSGSKHNLGFCPIGWNEIEKSDEHWGEFSIIHGFVGGVISEQQRAELSIGKNTSRSNYEQSELNVDGLQAYLKLLLPQYMIPTHFKRVSSMPLTSTGKIDRGAEILSLEVIEKSSTDLEKNQSQLEIIKLWSDIINCKDIAVDSSFFHMGGNSLSAMRMIAKINKEKGLNISLREFFENPTINFIVSKLSNIEKINNKYDYSLCEKRSADVIRKIISGKDISGISDINGLFQATPAQESMLLGELSSKARSSYNIVLAIQLKKHISTVKLQSLSLDLVKSNPVLAYKFIVWGGNYFLAPVNNIVIDIVENDLSAISDADYEKYLDELIDQEAAKKFDPLREILFRVCLFRRSGKSDIAVFTFHHLMVDFISLDILRAGIIEMLSGYEKVVDKSSTKKLQFRDFAIWQREFIESPEGLKQRNYWLKQLENSPEFTWKNQIERFDRGDKRGRWENYEVQESIHNSLLDLKKQSDNTMFIIGLAALFACVYKESNSSDICIGTPVNSRDHQDLDGLVGMMLNTLVIRLNVNPKNNAVEFLNSVRSICMEALANSEYPFEAVSQITHNNSNYPNPLYKIRFVYRTNADVVHGGNDEISILRVDMDKSEAKFDLLINLNETLSSISGSFEYIACRWDRKTIVSMANNYQIILKWIGERSGVPLSELYSSIDKENSEKEKALTDKRRSIKKLDLQKLMCD